jgi:hypothetical protein
MSQTKEKFTGGLEGQMDAVGAFLLIVSIVALIASISIANSDLYRGTGLSSIWIALGVVALVQGIVMLIVFRAGADVIRLLKKLNGMPYGGEIAEAKPVLSSDMSQASSEEMKFFECSECKTEVPANSKTCPKCGVKFEG